MPSAAIEVAAAAGDAAELVAAVEREQPDIAIVDVRMPPTFTDEGVRAALELRARRPELAVLVLSQYVEERYASELLARNARGVGYLLKDSVTDTREFLDAVERVAGGGTAIDPEVVSQLLARVRASQPLDELSPREREVLELMAQGRSNAAIAQRSSSPNAPSRSTSARSSRSCGCRLPTATTAASSPSSGSSRPRASAFRPDAFCIARTEVHR